MMDDNFDDNEKTPKPKTDIKEHQPVARSSYAKLMARKTNLWTRKAKRSLIDVKEEYIKKQLRKNSFSLCMIW